MSTQQPQRTLLDGDLDTKDKVDEMVRTFYAQVTQDDLLGHVFNEGAHVDWPTHLPKLELFWYRALFGEGGYHGNPYRAHLETHAKEPFNVELFHRWIELFETNLDAQWEGPYVEAAKTLAHKVAHVHCSQIVGVSPFPEETP